MSNFIIFYTFLPPSIFLFLNRLPAEKKRKTSVYLRISQIDTAIAEIFPTFIAFVCQSRISRLCKVRPAEIASRK